MGEERRVRNPDIPDATVFYPAFVQGWHWFPNLIKFRKHLLNTYFVPDQVKLCGERLFSGSVLALRKVTL